MQSNKGMGSPVDGIGKKPLRRRLSSCELTHITPNDDEKLSVHAHATIILPRRSMFASDANGAADGAH